MKTQPITYLEAAKKYTKRYYGKTAHYKRHKDSVFYHLVKFSEHLSRKTKLNKKGERIIKKYIEVNRCSHCGK